MRQGRRPDRAARGVSAEQSARLNSSPFLSSFNPSVREIPSGASLFYDVCGDATGADARSFAGQIRDLMREHGGGSSRLSVDKIMVRGLLTLERTRAIEGPAKMIVYSVPPGYCAPERQDELGPIAAGTGQEDIVALLHTAIATAVD